MEMLHGQNPPKNCCIVSAQGTPPPCDCPVGQCWFCSLQLLCLFMVILLYCDQKLCLSFYGDLTLQDQKLWSHLKLQVSPEDQTQWSVITLHYVAFKDRTQPVRVCSRHLYPLSYLASMPPCF